MLTDSEKLKIAERALRLIATPYECENYTSGIGSCFRDGRTVHAKFGAERCCNVCIADAGLRGIDAVPERNERERAVKIGRAYLWGCLTDSTIPENAGKYAARRIKALITDIDSNERDRNGRLPTALEKPDGNKL